MGGGSAPKPYRSLSHGQTGTLGQLGGVLTGNLPKYTANLYTNSKTGATRANIAGVKNPALWTQTQTAGELKYPNSPLGQGVTAYSGQIVPNLLPSIQALNQQVAGYDVNTGIPQAQQAIAPSLGGAFATPYVPVNQGYDYNPGQVKSTLTSADTLDYIQKGIITPAMSNFTNEILPALNQQYAGYGASFSSRRGYDANVAAQRLNTDITAQAANVTMQNEQLRSQQDLAAQQFNVQTGLQNAQFGAQFGLGQQEFNTQQRYNLATDAANRQLQAAQLSANLGSLPLQRTGMALNQLYPAQQQANAQAQAQYGEFQRTQPQNNPYIGTALNYAGLSTGGVYNPSNPLGAAALQVGGTLAGYAGAGLIQNALAGSAVAAGGYAAGGALAGFGGAAAGAGAGASAGLLDTAALAALSFI